MSNIRCNITELLQVLDIMPAEHNIMLVGNHGIGKSEMFWKQIILVMNKVNGDPHEDAHSYNTHHTWMQEYGRVCTMKLQG